MKKLLLSSAIVASLFASDKVLNKQQTLEVLKSSILYSRLAPVLKNVKLKGVENNSFYIIEIDTKKGKALLYITKDKKYTIIGQVIDNKTGQLVVPHFPINKELVKKGVSFTFGKGDKDIYVVTDPECPFCRIMEKKIGDKLAKNYKVHIILFPLPFHKHAKNMCYYILAGKTDAEKAKRFKETLQGGNEWKKFKPTKEEKEKFDKMLQNSKKAVENLGAQGTPTIYDENFNQTSWTNLLKDEK